MFDVIENNLRYFRDIWLFFKKGYVYRMEFRIVNCLYN